MRGERRDTMEAERPLGTDVCCHQLFEHQAAQHPERVALEVGDLRLTYRELGRRADQLSDDLCARGVGLETPVAICLERSVERVVAVLAVLKAGAGYVPLDLEYPRQRLALMLESARAQILLTRRDLVERLPEHDAEYVFVDSESENRRRSIPSEPVAANLAYVVFTSGSTGRPKGVAMPHGPLTNLIHWQLDQSSSEAASRTLQFAPFGFDVSFQEIFATLGAGGTLVLPTEEQRRNSTQLLELLEAQRLTRLFVPFVALRQLAEIARSREAYPSALCEIITAGEALQITPALCDLMRHLPACTLINQYGPAECHVVTAHRLDRAKVEEWPPLPPIGQAIEGASTYILDEAGQPVTGDEAGELYLGGGAVFRGYLHRPATTAERCLPDAFSQMPGGRLYRTGDLARFQPEGDIEFLGRADHQVKLRGYRIELGEIEVTLAGHSAVRQSVVTLHESATGARRLVAYVVPVEAREHPRRELVTRLRDHVRKRLPEYMVPASVVLLERWPLNPHGKVDRGALPAPSERPEQEYVAPRDPVEKRLTQLWARVLGTSRVGVHDDFLELGGDSLLGATIVNQLYGWLGEPVYVSAIFEAPTVAELATYLDKHYHEAMARLRGDTLQAADNAETAGIDDADIDRLQGLIPAPTPGPTPVGKNPPAIFVLAPPRSGSSVFRIMLGGHPELFAPPELELLGFGNLKERRTALSGGSRFLREGTVRALMDLKSYPPDRAEELMAELEAQGLSTQDFFGVLQERMGGRRLVDKTTSYPLHVETLQRAEEIFDGALYLHLVRHPGATVHSFRKARIDRLVRFDHPYTPRQLGELLWWISHRNIERFLASVGPQRQLRVSFEELVNRPEPVLQDICRFLGLEFHSDMADPYSHSEERMTDGLYAGSIGLTDFKFHQHKKLDPAVADRWRRHFDSRQLCGATRRLARALGYDDVPPAAPTLRTIEPSPEAEDHPLSLAQQRLWFLDQLGVGSAFNSSRAYRLAGELNVRALASGLSTLTDRHQTLRTHFVDSSGGPRQRVGAALEVSLPVVDLSALSEHHRKLVSRSLRDSEMHRPFDLTRGPLLRAVLLRLSSDDSEHLLILAIHHIVTDGWSWGVLQEELQEAYRAAVSAQAPNLPELALQYVDYARWQRRWLNDGSDSRGLTYWREQLSGTAPVLDLPFDRPRPRVLSARGGSIERVLDPEATQALRALSQQAGASLFMTLLTAFKVLLTRVSGQPEVWVGTSVAGRTHRELEGLIGFFLNFLVLRSDFSDEPSFIAALERVRRVALEAYDHQEIPFEKLLEDLQPERDLGRNPLFQTYCNMVHRSYSERGAGNLDLEIVDSSSAAARFDLDLHLVEHSDLLKIELRYKEELFEAATVERLLAWLLNLLEGAVTDPEQPISALQLLGTAERAELSGRRNAITPEGAGTDFPAAAVEQTIPARFARQLERDPEHIAIRTHEQSWTYRHLDLASNRVARALQGLVGELGGEHVALLFGPGSSFVQGLWGVLKAGHAYVPLDPSYPLERLRFVLEDSKATAIVTESSQVELARSLAGESVRLLIIDQLHGVPSEPVACPASPDSLAYILYTSGSTGRPKGVMQSHRGVLGHARAYARALRIGPKDRLTLLSSYTFDAAAMDLYGALLCGVTVCPLPLREQTLGDLLTTMSTLGVTIYHSTPSVFRYLFGSDGQAAHDFSRVRLVVLGGEEARREDLELFQRRFDPGCLLVNGLGPTESTLALQSFMNHSSRTDLRRLAVGYGVDGTSIDLLNRRGQPGEVLGEIGLTSDDLALGYWRRPRLTATAFTPAEEGGRRYRSGDLGRLRADGSLEFVGRRDAQLKIRGQRVEPGEVETALSNHPTVSVATVLAVPDAQGDNQLAAYVVLDPEAQANGADLRAFLRERLPEILVPGSIIFLDVLPLTPNGKLDRGALPAPEIDQQATSADYLAPRNPTEEQLVEIWQELLRVERVGVHDDFFALGGHSLLAMRLLAMITQTFGVELPVRAIFEAPTIADLEMEITRQLAEQQDDSELADMIDEIEGLSEEELQSLLAEAGT